MVGFLPCTVPLLWLPPFLSLLVLSSLEESRHRQPAPESGGWGCPLPEGCIHGFELFLTRPRAFSPCLYYASFTSTGWTHEYFILWSVSQYSCIDLTAQTAPAPATGSPGDAASLRRARHRDVLARPYSLPCKTLPAHLVCVPPPFQKKPLPRGALVPFLDNLGCQDQRAGRPHDRPRHAQAPLLRGAAGSRSCRGAWANTGSSKPQRAAHRGARSTSPHARTGGAASPSAGAAWDTPVMCAHTVVADTSCRLPNGCVRHTRTMLPLL